MNANINILMGNVLGDFHQFINLFYSRNFSKKYNFGCYNASRNFLQFRKKFSASLSILMTDLRIYRPIRISFLAICVLWFTGVNGLRLGEAIYFWKTLEEYRASPLYISLSGGLWLIIGLTLAWGLWQGKPWARIAGTCGIILYTFWYWFDRLVLEVPHANWPFVLIANIILLLILFILLFSQKSSLFYKRDVHERQPETPTTT